MNYGRGFIDLHTHGFGRYDTKTADPEIMLAMARLHGRAGTAAILPTIYPAPIDEMRKNMRAIRQAMEIQDERFRMHCKAGKGNPPARILGVNLEGPFISPSKAGALKRSSFLRPSTRSLKELIVGYEDIVKMITIAPELPGALRLIERCAESGIRVSMGHSDATYREAGEGKSAGATCVTHIFNAMRTFHHREPGLSGFGLLDDCICVEVIADGVHLTRETLKLVFRLKPRDKIILVSDSVKGAGRRGRPVKGNSGILLGGGTGVSGCEKVLRDIGISAEEVTEAGISNPGRYLGEPQFCL